MYFHPKDEYIYYRGDCDIKQRLTDRSASHFGRFAPQIRPMGCAICSNAIDYADDHAGWVRYRDVKAWNPERETE